MSALKLARDCQDVVAYNRGYVVGVTVGSNSDGLDEKLVAAFGIWWRVLFHRLEQDCNAYQHLRNHVVA